jgi:hypothetical protein
MYIRGFFQITTSYRAKSIARARAMHGRAILIVLVIAILLHSRARM